MEEPTPEYMATPGLLDRFNIMVGCTSGEVKKIWYFTKRKLNKFQVAMGAAAVRTKETFERIMGLLFKFLYPVDTNNPDFWYDLESFYLPSGDPTTTNKVRIMNSDIEI